MVKGGLKAREGKEGEMVSFLLPSSPLLLSSTRPALSSAFRRVTKPNETAAFTHCL